MLKNINNPFEINTFKMIFERKYFSLQRNGNNSPSFGYRTTKI